MRNWTTIAASVVAMSAAAPALAQQQPSVTEQQNTQVQTSRGKATVTTTTETTTTGPAGAVTVNGGKVVEQEYTAPAPEAPPSHFPHAIVEAESPAAAPTLLSGVGIAVMAGGGPTGFLAPDARHMTNTGAGWDARIAIGTNSIIGGEIGYFGGINAVSAPGLDSSADIMRNGVEGALRLNIVSGLFNPYVLGGVGWTNARIIDAAFNNSDVSQVDNMVHFPVGAGIGFHYRGVVIDTRGVFRPVVGGNMLGTNADQQMHTWEGKLSGGFEF